tara:strand:- start:726 stop:1598 length:873 start_codon:yes stop_codon:yes gene_type:complete
MKPVLGIIGGSGLYSLDGIKNIKSVKVTTPFGPPSSKINITEYKKLKVIFLPRHGSNHSIPPHKINYKANIFALKKLGVTDIISISAVGSLKNNHKPGEFLVVDQFIDRTVKRPTTFFEEDCVVHVSLAKPISEQLINLIMKSKIKGLKIKNRGTYIAIEGPQFSTYAESLLYKSWKCDVIGMTNMSEVRLAREAEMGYATIAMITDYDCWHKSHEAVTVEQVINIMNSNTKNVLKLLKSIFNNLEIKRKWNWNDKIYSCLDDAVLTRKQVIEKKTIEKLKPILKRRFCL